MPHPPPSTLWIKTKYCPTHFCLAASPTRDKISTKKMSFIIATTTVPASANPPSCAYLLWVEKWTYLGQRSLAATLVRAASGMECLPKGKGATRRRGKHPSRMTMHMEMRRMCPPTKLSPPITLTSKRI
jgi:hypothetical protein